MVLHKGIYFQSLPCLADVVDFCSQFRLHSVGADPSSRANSQPPIIHQAARPFAAENDRRHRDLHSTDARSQSRETLPDRPPATAHASENLSPAPTEDQLPPFDAEKPRYDSDISLEDDPSTHYPQTPKSEDHLRRATTPDQQSPHSAMDDVQHSPAMRRWSSAPSPEERIRLGLPRWESDEQRAEYEASVHHEASLTG